MQKVLRRVLRIGQGNQGWRRYAGYELVLAGAVQIFQVVPRRFAGAVTRPRCERLWGRK